MSNYISYPHTQTHSQTLASNPDFPLFGSLLTRVNGSELENFVLDLTSFLNSHPVHGSWDCRWLHSSRCYDYDEVRAVVYEYLRGVKSKTIPELDRRNPATIAPIERYLTTSIANEPAGRTKAILFAWWEGAAKTASFGERGLRTLWPLTYDARREKNDPLIVFSDEASGTTDNGPTPLKLALWIGGGVALLVALANAAKITESISEITN